MSLEDLSDDSDDEIEVQQGGVMGNVSFEMFVF